MMTFSDAVIADRLKALTRALDAKATGGKLLLYGGTQPAAGAFRVRRGRRVLVQLEQKSEEYR